MLLVVIYRGETVMKGMSYYIFFLHIVNHLGKPPTKQHPSRALTPWIQVLQNTLMTSCVNALAWQETLWLFHRSQCILNHEIGDFGESREKIVGSLKFLMLSDLTTKSYFGEENTNTHDTPSLKDPKARFASRCAVCRFGLKSRRKELDTGGNAWWA